jgi:A/G-specific adenine glycosylase
MTRVGRDAARGGTGDLPASVPADRLVAAVTAWYRTARRELPWRAPDRTPWGVLVSEVMLAQTPVARVEPVWREWLARWPTAGALAGAPRGEVIRAWGRLGYPRRALRLHEAAARCVSDFGGEVPATYEQLRSLPGVGDYTAAAVLAFAYGRRAMVLDTNVRRVLARVLGGQAAPGPSVTAAERARAEAVLPPDDATAAVWSVAVMELGALVCTARSPGCRVCPVAAGCAWNVAGKPPYDGPPRRTQGFAGTDRQVRGLLLAALRADAGPVPAAQLDVVWADPLQRARALDGLVADGLVAPQPDGSYALPH